MDDLYYHYNLLDLKDNEIEMNCLILEKLKIEKGSPEKHKMFSI